MKVFINYDIDINEKRKIYTNSELDNQFHYRKYDYPSYMWDRNNGSQYLIYKFHKLTYEEYRVNNKNHMLYGPAIIDYESNEVQYWIDGKQYKSEFEYWLDVGNYRKEKENK